MYRDPVTGKNIVYVDVTEEAKETDSSSEKTTSATSMKKTKYDAYFKKAAQRYGVSESLLKAIAKAESNFNAKDVSSAGAKGVMQLMPVTARSLGVKDVFDPEQNIMGGAKCIKQKLKEFNGNVRLALAAYNAGSGAVKRHGGIPSYCKNYINKVLSYKEAFETASAVG
ncbi:MAG: lytic transglycosylase domain-containing protein [Lachnospiraceae bacterium]|nr:lytic transglycosylase domain-containing protein [Lachnospiraceae bacterium]